MNFGWTLAGNVTFNACQWLLLVVIARLAGPTAVGRYALASAVATPVFLLTSLHLRGTVATDAAGLFRFADYLGVRVAGAVVGIVLTLCVALVARYAPASTVVIFAFAAVKAVEALADIYQALLQQHERMPPIARSLMMRGVLSVAAVGGVVWAGGGLALAMFAFSIGSLAVLVAYDIPNAFPLVRASGDSCWPRLHPTTARRIVAISYPLGIVTLAVSLRTYVPRFFVERRFGTAELGIFAAVSSFVTVGTLIISALGQSAMPRLARHFFRGELGDFRRLLRQLLLLSIAVGGAGVVGAAAVGEPMLRVVFGPAYAARSDVLLWVMAVGAVAYAASFLGYGLTSARLFGAQLPLFTSTTATCALACWWLVPARGLVGAVWAWGLSLVLELLASAAVLEVALRRRAAAARAEPR